MKCSATLSRGLSLRGAAGSWLVVGRKGWPLYSTDVRALQLSKRDTGGHSEAKQGHKTRVAGLEW